VLESFSYFIKNSAYQTFNFIEFKGLEYNHFKIEGDWSGSSFFLILAAIKGNAKISNLNRDSIQPDKIILKLLLEIGANISYHDNNIEVCSSILSSFNFDAENYPDLVPALIPLGLCCNGTSKIINVDRINFKESRRIDELVKSYKILGASIDYKDNELTISKSSLVYSALDNKNDHRLAMSYAVAYKLIDSKLQLKEDQCVSKSYINFYRDLNKVQLYE